MNTHQQSTTMPELTRAWIALQDHAALRPIRSAADFRRMRVLGNRLADSVGDDDSHPLASLFDIVMELIGRWEDEHVKPLDVPPREMLRHLLDVNGLKQKDLGDIASPALISDILAGRRAVSKRLAKALAARFHIDVAAFL